MGIGMRSLPMGGGTTRRRSRRATPRARGSAPKVVVRQTMTEGTSREPARFRSLAVVGVAVLALSCASGDSPGPLERSESSAACEPWASCRAAEWLRGALERSAFSVEGDTGSALVTSGGDARFYAWSTAGPGQLAPSEGYEGEELGGVLLESDGTRFTWWTGERRVWLQVGPAPTDIFPTRETMERLIGETDERDAA